MRGGVSEEVSEREKDILCLCVWEGGEGGSLCRGDISSGSKCGKRGERGRERKRENE